MMRFHAVAVGFLFDDRAVQSFSNSETSIREWAAQTAAKHGVPITINEAGESFLDTVYPPAPELL